jgi:hypothetical protein
VAAKEIVSAEMIRDRQAHQHLILDDQNRPVRIRQLGDPGNAG